MRVGHDPGPAEPDQRPGTPRSARDILNRLNEVSFNAVLLKELKMIALLRQLADPGNGEGAPQWASMRIHMVRNPIMAELGYSSKLNAEWPFLTMLRDPGPARRRGFPDDPSRRPRASVLARYRSSAGGHLMLWTLLHERR